MSKRVKTRLPEGSPLADPDFFDLAGSNPELLNSGRIPDPLPAHTPLFRWLATIFTALEARLRARGGASLRVAIKIFWGFVAVVSLFLLVGPVINEPLDFDDVIASAKLSEVDWIATDANLDYIVTRDHDGHFRVNVSEGYTANFTNGPERFIHRAFVTEFRGHHTGFELQSATIDGAPAKATVSRGPTTTRVSLSRADGERFEGKHEITFEYELRDLAAVETDTAVSDENERWLWPVLGPSWPQATKGVEVSLTLAHEVDAALVRAPRATVGWLLLSATKWLTPEGATSEGVRYSFSNDDTLPPHPHLVLDVRFEAGTFTQPATTPLFWLQSWGALIPLALLAAMLFFALAARRVVWADSAGEPWYLARAEPPANLAPIDAAQLLELPGHAELIEELGSAPAARTTKHAPLIRARELWVASLARVGMRAGRIGNLPTVARYRVAWAKRDATIESGLKWVPDSYIRDTFIFGSLAIALLQWALLRQLSHQVVLTVVWWPGLFVIASTVLALVIVGTVWRPRPLTRQGALIMQQLKGIDVWARGTRLLERGPIDDPLLPYAALFERARQAGRAVTGHAERESGDRWISRGWRGERFIRTPAVLALMASLLILAGTILTASLQPPPYATSDYVTWPGSGPSGAIWAQNEGLDARAEIVTDNDGGATVQVVERNSVRFSPGGAAVPQYVREWPRERLGQDLGLTVDAVRIEGEPQSFRTIDGAHSIAVVTELQEVLDGLYNVEVSYTLSSPVITVDAKGGQQLRWVAWLRFWDDTYYTNPRNPFDGSAPVRPIRLQVTVAPEIADQMQAGGWIAYDLDRPTVPHESGNWHRSWEHENRAYDDDSQAYELRIGVLEQRADGSFVATLDVDQVESREVDAMNEGGEFATDPEVNAWLGQHELRLTSDAGAVLYFAPGTFASVDPGAYERHELARALPYVLLMAFGVLITVASLGIAVFAWGAGRRPSLSLEVVSYGAIPIAAVAQSVYCWWQIGSMVGTDPRGGFALGLGAVLWIAVIAQWVVVARRGSAKVSDEDPASRRARPA